MIRRDRVLSQCRSRDGAASHPLPTPLILHRDGALRLEGASAAAGLDGVGILKSKALLFQAFMPIDGGPVEIKRAFLVDDHRDAVAFELRIRLFVVAFVKIQRVVESAATTARDPDSQHHRIIEIVLLAKPIDLLGGAFC